MPGAGGKTWSVPTPNGDVAISEIAAIIVAFQPCRAYWPGAYQGNVPPACSSPDGKTGFGDPGGDCRTCPHAQWGTAVDQQGNRTRGQACKSLIRIFLLTEGVVMPYLLALPPTSLKAYQAYLVKRTMVPESYRSVITRIGLEANTNEAGIKYSRATFEKVRGLDAESSERIERYAESVGPLLTVPVMAEDYAAGDVEL